MNCKPKPVITCGTTIPDSCVPITITWPSCFGDEPDCPRQSEWNSAAQDTICAIKASVLTIESSIDLSNLTGCDSIEPVKETVNQEFQNLYNVACDLQDQLTNWANLPLPDNFDTACLGNDCCNTIPTTLGELLTAIVSKLCCVTSNGITSDGSPLNTVCPDC